MSFPRMPRLNPCPCSLPLANPRGAGPWVVWHKKDCARVRNGEDQADLLSRAGYKRVAQFASHAEADRRADRVYGGRLNPSDAERRADLARHESHEEDVSRPYDRYATEKVRIDDGGGAWHYEMVRPAEARRIRRAQARENPKLLVLNPSGSRIERDAEKRLGRRLTSAEQKALAQAVKEYKVFHGREPETIIPVEVPNGTPKFVNLVGDVDRVDYTVKANSDRRGRWTHKAGDHGRTAKKTIPAFLVSIPGKRTPPVFAQRGNSKMFFKPSHGIMG